MKQEMKILLVTVLFFTAGLTIGNSQVQWNKEECKQFVNYIHTNGVKTKLGNSTMTLPIGTISAINDEVIGIDTEYINFWFFYKEKSDFKGNLLNGMYMFRLPTKTQTQNIKKHKNL